MIAAIITAIALFSVVSMAAHGEDEKASSLLSVVVAGWAIYAFWRFVL
jgi:hypothetical protein